MSLIGSLQIETRSPVIAEKVDRTALAGIAVQHANDGYSRHAIFSMFLINFIRQMAPMVMVQEVGVGG